MDSAELSLFAHSPQFGVAFGSGLSFNPDAPAAVDRIQTPCDQLVGCLGGDLLFNVALAFSLPLFMAFDGGFSAFAAGPASRPHFRRTSCLWPLFTFNQLSFALSG